MMISDSGYFLGHPVRGIRQSKWVDTVDWTEQNWMGRLKSWQWTTWRERALAGCEVIEMALASKPKLLPRPRPRPPGCCGFGLELCGLVASLFFKKTLLHV